MGYKVKYAGVNLHDYFKILNIKRGVLPPRKNFTKTIPSVNGEIYTGFKYEPKTIVLDCVFIANDRLDYVDILKEISFILDTKEPKKLITEDNPNCYCYAVVDGSINIDRRRHNGKFEIPFICYDPFDYSIDEDYFYNNSKGIVSVDNGGTTEAYPVTSIEFSKQSYFLQCTNYAGETILVGTPPSVDKQTTSFSPEVLRDTCMSLSGWTSVGNVVDSGREVSGGMSINGGGYAFTYGSINGGTADKWYGSAMRRNLGQNLSDFKIEVKMEHNSQGDIRGVGAGTNPPSTTTPTNWVDYTVTAEPSLRVRSGRSTNDSQIGTYNKGAKISVCNISQNWGQVNYSGKTGYVSMDYLKKYVAPTPTPTSNYKITASSGLNMRSGRGTNYGVVTAIPNGKVVSVSDISNGWGKTTYNSKTGYISMQYTSKVSSTFSMLSDDTPSAENKLGLIEIYGFDQNGTKLFKFKLSDDQKWYEYTEPSVEFGSSLVLDDGKKCPSPKTVDVKSDGDKTVKQDTHSGQYGDWNDMIGWFTLERKTVSGKQQWKAKIEKIDASGKVVKAIQTQTLTGNYPTGLLNSIVVYFGQYNNEPIVDVMTVNEIYVTNLINPPAPEVIQPLFKKGDELLLDHSTQKIYKNGKPIMNELDIGSQFFSVPVGNSEFICKSDDTQINVISSIQKKWL